MNIIQVYQTNPFEEGQGGGVRYVKNLLSGLKASCDSILFIGDIESFKNSLKLSRLNLFYQNDLCNIQLV